MKDHQILTIDNALTINYKFRTMRLGGCVPLSVLVALAALFVGPPAAYAGKQLQYSSLQTEQRCGGAAGSAGASDGSACEVAPRGSAREGRVGTDLLLVSPMDGQLPWNAAANGYSSVVAKHYLDSPVPQLDLTVRIHVEQAETVVERSLAGDLLGFDASILVPQSVSGHEAASYVSAGAEAAGCMPNCVTGSTISVLSERASGTKTAEGEDYVIDLALTNNNCGGLNRSPTCGQVPAGEVTVTAGAGVRANQPNTWGIERASIDAVVTSISVD
jgi:hypothetical protein